MVKTIEEIRELIDNDLDWMFKVGEVEQIDYKKTLKGEWDYVLKIKFKPPTPIQLQKMLYDGQRFKELMNKHGYYDSSR